MYRRSARRSIWLCGWLLAVSSASTASEPLLPADLGAHARSHDVRAPAWGPYSNAYLGLSHVTDQNSGLRFDVSLFAGGHTTTTPSVPNASLNTGMVAWDAGPDLDYYAFRQRIDGERMYAQLAYAGMDERTRVIRADLVNTTGRPRTITLNLVASLQLPNRGPNHVLIPRRILQAQPPPGARWINAVHYAALEVATPRPQDRLVYDGRLRNEERDDGMVDGRALSLRAGDRASYALGQVAPGSTLVLRYRAPKGATLAATGLGNIALPAGSDYQTHAIALPDGAAASFTLENRGSDPLELNGLALGGRTLPGQLRFVPEDRDTTPEIIAGPVQDSLLLKYRQSDRHYGLRWYRKLTRVRQYRNGILDHFFGRYSMPKTALDFRGDGAGHYTNLHFRGAPVPARGSETIWAVVTEGSRAQVEAALRTGQDEAETAFEQARRKAAPPPRLAAGARYDLARQLIRANLLLNIVYPVYTQDQYIRHFAPGKWWDSLYTWDSGFIGLGMAAVAPRLSADVLNAYTTAPGTQSAFIHHGTPLPVQHTQFLELWNRSQDRGLLEHAYPRLRQYYEFLVGRFPSSSTARLQSGLLTTWDYFYNSGGWDDYPAQVQMHERRMASHTAPMVSTSHAIRAARILRMAALELGRADDAAVYDADIARLARAIQQHAWDPQSGYFGYVVHDEAGNPAGLLRTASGEQANLGLDGVQPLIAGIATPEQTRSMLQHITTEGRLWSPVGITAVDQRASYYNPLGYWNGTVWFPHQYFLWKILLDLGRDEEAWRIARTALGLYQREAADSWTSAEHFEIATGQGVGWHQFSGLSGPVANWYASYFELGSLTAGYDVWIRKRSWQDGHRRLEAELALYPTQHASHGSLLAVVPPGHYRASWNGAPLVVRRLESGTLSIRLPAGRALTGVLRLWRAAG